MVYNTYNKIIEFNPNATLLEEYSAFIIKIKKIIEQLDIIELQFNKFHTSMPPLNESGFVKLDDFQKEVITNIDNNTLTIKNSWGTKGDYEIEDENQSEEELTVNFVEDNKLEWNKLKQLVEDKIIFIELTFIIPTKSSNKYFNNFLNIFKKSRRIAGKLKNKKSKKKKKYLTRRQLRKT